MRVRYHGPRTLGSLIAFYNNVTSEFFFLTRVKENLVGLPHVFQFEVFTLLHRGNSIFTISAPTSRLIFLCLSLC
jgi:hypothetical protein